MYYNARTYDPPLGRFISADAIVPEPGNPQSLNRYAYVKNNPLRYVDPSGHISEKNIAAGCGIDVTREDWEDLWHSTSIYKKWFSENSVDNEVFANMFDVFERGDILKFEKYDKQFEVMLMQLASNGNYVLWDINRHGWFGLHHAIGADAWALYKNTNVNIKEKAPLGFESYSHSRGAEGGWVGRNPHMENNEAWFGISARQPHVEIHGHPHWKKLIAASGKTGIAAYGVFSGANPVIGALQVAIAWLPGVGGGARYPVVADYPDYGFSPMAPITPDPLRSYSYYIQRR